MLNLIKVRLIRVLLIVVLLFSGTTLVLRPALAQSASCRDFNFPQAFEGWNVLAGTIVNTGSAYNVITPNLSQHPIDIDLNLGGTQYLISSIQEFSYQNLLTTGGIRQISILLYDIDGNYVTGNISTFNDTGGWTMKNVGFALDLQQNAPVTRIEVRFNSAIGFPINSDAAIHIGTICLVPFIESGPTATGTAFVNSSLTPAIPTRTPTSTRTPTLTRTPTNTLTPSNTPTPSYTPTSIATNTPGGPTETDTPVATNTSIASATVLSTVGPINSTLSAGLFSTMIPPSDACTNVMNPCGALPAVPNMPGFSLPSPVPITAVALLPTSTMISAGTSAPGTPSGTPSGTPTLPGGENINPVSTIVANYSNSLGTLAYQGTPSFVIGGTPQSISGLAGSLTASAGTFISYVKGIGLVAQNKVMQLLLFLVLLVVFIILIEFLVFFIPLIIRVITFVLDLIQTIPFV